jgi:urease accessory protein UreE
MLRELGARCTRRGAPFQPEAGAYAGGHHHA